MALQPEKGIIELLLKTIKAVPFYKYILIVVALVFIFALCNIYSLDIERVFRYSVYGLLICFVGATLNIIVRKKDKVINNAYYAFIYVLFAAVIVIIAGFVNFVFYGKPVFFKKFIKDDIIHVKDSVITPPPVTKDTVVINPVPKNVVAPQKENAALSIQPTGFAALDKRLKNAGYKITNINPAVNIVITYAGDVELVTNNLHRYIGGYVVIKVNNTICSSLQNLQLQPTFSGGAGKQTVLDEINTQLSQAISANEKLIFQTIQTCLK